MIAERGGGFVRGGHPINAPHGPSTGGVCCPDSPAPCIPHRAAARRNAPHATYNEQQRITLGALQQGHMPCGVVLRVDRQHAALCTSLPTHPAPSFWPRVRLTPGVPVPCRGGCLLQMTLGVARRPTTRRVPMYSPQRTSCAFRLSASSTKTKSSRGLQGGLPASNDPDPTWLRFCCIYTTRGFASKIQAHVRERSACMLFL